jgi:hypothetical protein
MAHTEKDCLHCAINKIIEERAKRALEADAVINLPDWLGDMMLSVADLILCAAPPEERKNMLAHAIARLVEAVPGQSGKTLN